MPNFSCSGFAEHNRFRLNSKERDAQYNAGLILGLGPATERRRYKVTLPFIGWA